MKDFIESNFSEKTRENIYKELDMDEEELADFDMFKELEFAIDCFQSKKITIKNLYNVYDIKDIRKCGILQVYKKGQQSSVNDRGFIYRNCPTLFRDINIYTGTKYDEQGYDIKGRDADGFGINGEANSYGFYKSGIHKNTGTHLDENFFDVYGNYWEVDPNFPNDISKRKNTYKPINNYGFDRDKKYYEEDEKGNLVYIGMQDRLGFYAFLEFNERSFRRNGINFHTDTILDRNFFDIEGNYWEEISDGMYHENPENDPSKRRNTHRKYDNHGFDCNHIHKDTGTTLSPENFDYKGWFYKKNNKGNLEKTISKYNDDGIDIDGWDVFGVDKDGVNHYTKTITPRGFNQKNMHIVTRTFLDEYDFDVDEKCYIQMEDGKWIETKNEYGEDGFNVKGLNKRKFRRKDKINIETKTIVDKDGFDIDGIYWKKDENGKLICTNSEYNPKGYNVKGFDKHNFNRNHLYKKIFRQYGRNEVIWDKYNNESFDYLGNYQYPEQKGADQTHNPDGFDIDATHRDTGTIVDPNGFNMKHEYCIQNDKGEWISTGNIYNDSGFDSKGKYHRLLEDGTRAEESSGKYDDEGYDINRT